MQATFFHKLILSLVIGASLGGMVEWYKVFVSGADDALNGGHRNKYSIQGKR